MFAHLINYRNYSKTSRTLLVNNDGQVRTQGAFGSWILGRDEIDMDVRGSEELELRVKVEDVGFEPFIIYPPKKTVFCGCIWKRGELHPCSLRGEGNMGVLAV